MALPSITFDVSVEPDEEPHTFPPVEPPRHFCGLDCLRAWAQRRADEPPP